MKSKKNKYIFVIDFLMVFAITLTVIYVIFTKFYWKEDNLLSTLKSVQVTDGWERVYEDGTRESIQLDGSDHYAKANEVLAVENVLPEKVEDNTYYSFRAKRQQVRVFIDGELRTDFTFEAGFRDMGKVVSRYLFVELKREDSGKVIRIEGYSDKDGNRKLTPVYYGEKAGIITSYMRSQTHSIVIAISILSVGLLSIVLGFALKFVTSNSIRTDYIGWAMLLIAIWDFSQSDFRDFFFNNITMISVTSAFALLIISIPLALYFNFIQRGRYKKIYYVLMGISTVNVPLMTSLGSMGIINYSQALIPAFVELFSLAAIFLILVVIDIKKGYAKEYRLVIFGAIMVSVGGLCQMIMYYSPRESETGSYLCVGMVCLAFGAFAHALRYIFKINSEKTAALIAAESKSQFLATMSHEIRTPINGVLGMNEAIRRETTEDNIRSYADDVDKAGNLLLTLINDILDFSKLDSNKMTLLNEPYKPVDVIDYSLEVIEHRAKEKGLALETKVNSKLPSIIYGDEVRIKQIVTNLLTNAVKYTEKGKITFIVNFTLKSEDEIFLRIIVRDTGRGIKDEDLGKLFSAFTRIEESKNKKIEGTGLGLVIISKLVEMMNGEISVKSTYGVGSTFEVGIPCKVADMTPIGEYHYQPGTKSSQKKVLETFDATGMRAIVVDDVDMNLRVFKTVLKSTGMIIDTAKSGDECLAKTAINKYDIIFLDHMMPEKDGVETLKDLREMKDNLNWDTPVVMMTANVLGSARDDYLALGFDEYISKPFKVQDVERVIKAINGGK